MTDIHSLLMVKDLIKDKPVFVKSDSTVLEVAKKMKKKHVDCVLISGMSGNIAGIVTQLDIVCKVVAEDENPSEIDAKKIMTKKLLAIDGNESMFKARQVMLDNNVKHLIVTNGRRQIGVVTSKEILGK